MDPVPSSSSKAKSEKIKKIAFSGIYGRKLKAKIALSRIYDKELKAAEASINFGCRDRASDLSSKIPPWLMLSPSPYIEEEEEEKGSSKMVYNFYKLANKKVKSITRDVSSSVPIPADDYKNKLVDLMGSSHGWLVLFNQRNCNLFLSNPLSGRHIKLPAIQGLRMPETDLSHGIGCVERVIISCTPDHEECRALMIYSVKNRLAFCCPPFTTTQHWIPLISSGEKKYYVNFVYSPKDKLFYCLTGDMDVESWDLADPSNPIPKLVPFDDCTSYPIPRPVPFDDYYESDSEYLEELPLLGLMSRLTLVVGCGKHSGELFLVIRHVMPHVTPNSFVDVYNNKEYPYKTIRFDVYNIDIKERKKLERMDRSLGGMSFFIGKNHSFAMTMSNENDDNIIFPGFKPDSIYYTDDVFPVDLEYQLFGGHDVGIYNYAEEAFSPCYYPCDVKSVEKLTPAPMWFTPYFI